MTKSPIAHLERFPAGTVRVEDMRGAMGENEPATAADISTNNPMSEILTEMVEHAVVPLPQIARLELLGEFPGKGCICER